MTLEEKFKKHVEKLQNNHFTVSVPKLIHDFAKIANSEFTNDYKLQQKAINTLNDSGLKLMEENKKLVFKLANQPKLNRQEVEKIFDKYVEYDDKTLEDGDEIYWREIKIYNEDIDKLITAICNLALKIDRDKITAILVGKILESNKDAVVIADEIIKSLGGQQSQK